MHNILVDPLVNHAIHVTSRLSTPNYWNDAISAYNV